MPIYPFRKNSLLVMSDIHRAAHISALPDYEAALVRQMGAFEHVVLNGDNFELFYLDAKFFNHDASTAPHTLVKSAVKDSLQFLETCLQQNPQTTIHLVLGNHELIHKFRNGLDKLQQKYPNFEWSPEAIKIGNALFVHGDLAMDGAPTDHTRTGYTVDSPATDSKRTTHRQREAKDAMGWQKMLNVRMEEPGQAVVNFWRKPSRCIPILDRWLMRHNGTKDANGMPELSMSEGGVHKPFHVDGIKHVFFGHTHVKFSYLPSTQFSGLMYHNTGALTKTVMNQKWFGRGGHGMLEADIRGGRLENIRPYQLENNRGELARA